MKKHILILLFILMTLTAAAQNKLYDRYASRQDLTVARVDGFRLNDSTKVDVVMLVADDATSWQANEGAQRQQHAGRHLVAGQRQQSRTPRAMDGSPRDTRCGIAHTTHRRILSSEQRGTI